LNEIATVGYERPGVTPKKRWLVALAANGATVAVPKYNTALPKDERIGE
jgi:hypothetical protein